MIDKLKYYSKFDGLITQYSYSNTVSITLTTLLERALLNCTTVITFVSYFVRDICEFFNVKKKRKYVN